MFIVALIRMVGNLGSASFSWLSLVGYVLIALLIATDFYVGDVKQLLSKRDSSFFEILHELENRVYVCRWVGPAKHNATYFLPETVCGLPNANQRSLFRHVMVIAVIQ